MDVQTAEEFAKSLRSIVRRSYTFGKTRENILEELTAMAENYERVAARIDREISEAYEKELI
jgi:hypothetical protein